MSALWQPTWKAATAYTLTAVVVPTTFGGFTWKCITAGTSAGVEPVWPVDPNMTPTIVDGGVTWSVGTGFRQAMSSGLDTLVSAFAVANPTIIRSVVRTRPLSFANVEFPCFFIGDLSETITTTQGVRTRTFAGFSAFLVDALGSVQESADRMDFAADALADLFTANYHVASGRSIFQHIGTIDTEVPNGPTPLPALEFQFGETAVAEGRI